MQITWLGQSGFLLRDGETSIVIDPYFSDSVATIRKEFKRMVPVDPAFAESACDLLLFTHCHLDHTDPETVKLLIGHNPGILLAGPISSYSRLHDVIPSSTQYAILCPGGGLVSDRFNIEAIPSYHSDARAVGYIIRYGDDTLYFSGDTALVGGLVEALRPKKPQTMFLCINGGIGRNMDGNDALKLLRQVKPRTVVPCHFGMFPEPVDVDGFISQAGSVGVNAIEPEPFKTVLKFNELKGDL